VIQDVYPCCVLWINPEGQMACITATDGQSYLVYRERRPFRGESFPEVWKLPWEPRAGEVAEFSLEFYSKSNGEHSYCVTHLQPMSGEWAQQDMDSLYAHYRNFVRKQRDIQKTRRQRAKKNSNSNVLPDSPNAPRVDNC